MRFWQEGSVGVVNNVADLAGNFPANRLSNQFKAIVYYQLDHDLFWDELEVSGFRKKVFIPEEGMVSLTYKMGVVHRGIDAGAPYGIEYPIGLGSRPMYRSASTEAGLAALPFIYYDYGLSAGQLMDYTHRKYTMGAVRVPFNVEADTHYEFSLSGGSHTNAGSRDGADGSAEISTTNVSFLLIEYQSGQRIS